MFIWKVGEVFMKRTRHTPTFRRIGKYANPYSKGLKHGLFDIILWKAGFRKEKETKKPPLDFSFPLKIDDHDKLKPRVVWINHSSFLIEIENINFLTDPVWSKKCSPFRLLGPSRRHSPAFSLDKLPLIDYVLISHNHYDHLDKRTIKKIHKIYPNVKWIVPEGVKKWFTKNSIFTVIELSWWQSIHLDDVSITAVPAQHFSGRHILDYNNTLWAGYIVENKKTKKKFYFVGDTGYNEYDFKKIGEKWKKIDLSLIPIGGYIPRSFLRPIHIDPYEAVKIHKDVNSKFSVGMHWKTFHLSDEPLYLPPYDLFLAMKEENLDPKDFVTIEPGLHVNW